MSLGPLCMEETSSSKSGDMLRWSSHTEDVSAGCGDTDMGIREGGERDCDDSNAAAAVFDLGGDADGAALGESCIS